MSSMEQNDSLEGDFHSPNQTASSFSQSPPKTYLKELFIYSVMLRSFSQPPLSHSQRWAEFIELDVENWS